MDQASDWAGPRLLRLATVISFAVAVPLCIGHAVVSHLVVPAVGLAPLAASAILGAYCVHLTSRPAKARTEDDFAVAAAGSLGLAALDAVLATALAVVVAFAWLATEQTSGMLAAYATVPLLFSLLSHVFWAGRGVHQGLALDRVAQWLAWRAVPAECPSCGHNLRPPPPSPPWVRGAARLSLSLSQPPRWWPCTNSYAKMLASGDDSDSAVAYADEVNGVEARARAPREGSDDGGERPYRDDV